MIIILILLTIAEIVVFSLSPNSVCVCMRERKGEYQVPNINKNICFHISIHKCSLTQIILNQTSQH